MVMDSSKNVFLFVIGIAPGVPLGIIVTALLLSFIEWIRGKITKR